MSSAGSWQAAGEGRERKKEGRKAKHGCLQDSASRFLDAIQTALTSFPFACQGVRGGCHHLGTSSQLWDFPSSQSDIYLTLQLHCAGNAKFGGCKHSPCCRVYTWGLARSAHTHARARAAPGHTQTLVHGDTARSLLTAGLQWQRGTAACQHLSIHHAPSGHRRCRARPAVHAADRFARAKHARRRRRISVRVPCGWTRSLAYPSGVPCTEMITGWLHVFLSKHGAGDARIEVSLSCCGHVQAPRTLRSEGARSRGHAFAKSLGGVGKTCLWAVVRASLPSQMFFPASSDVAVLPQRPPCVGCLGPKASFMGVESALGDHRQGLDGSQSLYRL
eukprot:XP_027300921.1 uncharacterized protein LOC113839939 [Anas platyrhynchos]